MKTLCAGVVAALLAVVTGCSMPAATPPPSAPAAPATTQATPGTTAPADPDAAVCIGETSSASTVRGITGVAGKEPVLPAAVALFLLDARQKAAAPGPTDPVLVAALAELVAAIDDLDAQGTAGLPPGGNAARDKVQLDVRRIDAAADAVEKACAPHRN